MTEKCAYLNSLHLRVIIHLSSNVMSMELTNHNVCEYWHKLSTTWLTGNNKNISNNNYFDPVDISKLFDITTL